MTDQAPQNEFPVAFYDFRHWPLTYDFVSFLALASLYFKREGATKWGLAMLNSEVRCATEYEQQVVKEQNVTTRFNHIVYPVLNEIQSVAWFANIKTDHRKIPYNIDFPWRIKSEAIDFRKIHDGAEPWHAKHFDVFQESGLKPILLGSTNINRFVDPYITLSLRTTGQKPQRKTTLKSYYYLYKYLVARGFKVIVVPDHDDFFGEREAWSAQYEWVINQRSSWDLHERVKVYDNAFANIMPNAGWNTLVLYSGIPFLMFMLDSRALETSKKHYDIYGPKFGSQRYWFSPEQKYNWIEIEQLESNPDYLVAEVNNYLNEVVNYNKVVRGLN